MNDRPTILLMHNDVNWTPNDATGLNVRSLSGPKPPLTFKPYVAMQ